MIFYEKNEDEIVVICFAIYVIDCIKILYFMKINPVDVIVIMIGNCILYRRYLLVLKIDKMCNEIREPLHNINENIREILNK